MKKLIIFMFLITLVSFCTKAKDKTSKQKEPAKKEVKKAVPDKSMAKADSYDLVSQSVEYKDGDKILEGYLVYDKKLKGKRPGVLVAHAWMGLDAYAKRRADQLAKLGYIAFALDIYGKGIKAKDHKEAGKLSGMYFVDRKLFRARAIAGYKILAGQDLVKADKIASIGYCFGGASVLELARSGANLKGVVTFHGFLGSPTPKDAKNIKAKVLVFHGAKDTFVKADQVKAFKKEMTDAKVNFKFVSFPNAVHAFTVKEAGTDPSKGMAYTEEADKESWKQMKAFLKEVLG